MERIAIIAGIIVFLLVGLMFAMVFYFSDKRYEKLSKRYLSEEKEITITEKKAFVESIDIGPQVNILFYLIIILLIFAFVRMIILFSA